MPEYPTATPFPPPPVRGSVKQATWTVAELVRVNGENMILLTDRQRPLAFLSLVAVAPECSADDVLKEVFATLGKRGVEFKG